MAFYMKINTIDGNVSTQGHNGWIALHSLQHSVKRKLVTQPGQVDDREGTIPHISELVVTKTIDQASPKLYAESCSGTSQGTIIIDACHTDKEMETYLQYTLSDAIISKYEVVGMSDEQHHDELREKLHINFTKIQMKFVPRDANNRATSPIISSYNLQTAQTG